MKISNSFRQSITTKYHGTSSRISATCQAGRVYIDYMQGDGVQLNHDNAAKACIEKFEWNGEWVSGGSQDGSGYVYIDLSGVQA